MKLKIFRKIKNICLFLTVSLTFSICYATGNCHAMLSEPGTSQCASEKNKNSSIKLSESNISQCASEENKDSSIENDEKMEDLNEKKRNLFKEITKILDDSKEVENICIICKIFKNIDENIGEKIKDYVLSYASTEFVKNKNIVDKFNEIETQEKNVIKEGVNSDLFTKIAMMSKKDLEEFLEYLSFKQTLKHIRKMTEGGHGLSIKAYIKYCERKLEIEATKNFEEKIKKKIENRNREFEKSFEEEIKKKGKEEIEKESFGKSFEENPEEEEMPYSKAIIISGKDVKEESASSTPEISEKNVK